jgi:hypothetical protein
MRRLLMPFLILPAAALLIAIGLMAVAAGVFGFAADRLSAKETSK